MCILLVMYTFLTLMRGCSVSTPSTTSASPSPNSSAKPSSIPSPSASPSSITPKLSTSGLSPVSATPQTYIEYLGCIAEKHPESTAAIVQGLIKTGVYDTNWEAYRPIAQTTWVDVHIKYYGHICGS